MITYKRPTKRWRLNVGNHFHSYLHQVHHQQKRFLLYLKMLQEGMFCEKQWHFSFFLHTLQIRQGHKAAINIRPRARDSAIKLSAFLQSVNAWRKVARPAMLSCCISLTASHCPWRAWIGLKHGVRSMTPSRMLPSSLFWAGTGPQKLPSVFRSSLWTALRFQAPNPLDWGQVGGVSLTQASPPFLGPPRLPWILRRPAPQYV